ncbi:DUF1476 domain-containing protein (plasmid) [Skermanella rosea]|uniref:ATPase inhibitor subunit zeta n=1 Tax=Skermanella rosea TaxID=1817965 RepID=UPI001931CC24|nr:ATPase inhibitor subunit zeta [Skermanella rosea]UEM07451.1 DUF1476 domain-containing protein [Skermanella rosea]
MYPSTERQNGIEAQFSLGQQLLFRAQVRRARRLAAWAAGKRRLTPSQAAEYADVLVGLQMEPRGNRLIVDRVFLDLVRDGCDIPRTLVEREAEHLLTLAEAEIRDTGAPAPRHAPA